MSPNDHGVRILSATSASNRNHSQVKSRNVLLVKHGGVESVILQIHPKPTTTMSAAAARRRKQQQKKKLASTNEEILKLLDESGDSEASAYEALQLAVSLCQKHQDAVLACTGAKLLLQKGRISVASQLMDLAIQLLRETETASTDSLVTTLVGVGEAHATAIADRSDSPDTVRLQRVCRDWWMAVIAWSSDFGTVRYGDPQLHAAAAEQCWALATKDSTSTKDVEEEEQQEDQLYLDAIQHGALAEKPSWITDRLKECEKPTDEQTAAGHTVTAALRDRLLTKAVLVCVAVENVRDAATIAQKYAKEIEERDIDELAKSYTNKSDGKAPSHIIFCNMLLRIVCKDVPTKPLFQWLLRSFAREGGNDAAPLTTKIGRLYFQIQPPPNMLSMMENMMGGGGLGGGAGGINPAMMQAALAQMQGGGM